MMVQFFDAATGELGPHWQGPADQLTINVPAGYDWIESPPLDPKSVLIDTQTRQPVPRVRE